MLHGTFVYSIIKLVVEDVFYFILFPPAGESPMSKCCIEREVFNF